MHGKLYEGKIECVCYKMTIGICKMSIGACTCKLHSRCTVV